MSSTVRQYGFIAALLNPIPENELEELHERLYDDKKGIGINYDGSLVYFDANRTKSFRERENIYGLWIGNSDTNPEKFLKTISEYGFEIILESLKPYNCIYYNGSDSPLDMLEKKDFYTAALNQEGRSNG